MFRTEGVGLKPVTNQKGTRGRKGRGGNMRVTCAVFIAGKLWKNRKDWKINKISLIQIAEDDPSLNRGFQNLNLSCFSLKILLPSLSDPSVTSTRLHVVVNFHSHACDSNT